jgi:hypothetical protein
MYGKGWKKIASLIKTRTVVQIRTHAQKYFLKLAKARQNGETGMSMDGKVIGSGKKVNIVVFVCNMVYHSARRHCNRIKTKFIGD